MKKPVSVILLSFMIVNAFTQPDQRGLIDSALIPVPYLHYEKEYDFDKSIDPGKWELQKNLHVSFVSTDEAYFRTEVPGINETKTWTATGWKGERLNTMVLVWSADTINQIRVLLNDLKTANGAVLGKNNLKAQLVRYVISNYPYGAREVTCGVGPLDKAYLMPDRLAPMSIGSDRFELPGKTVRPVWLSLDIPSTIAAGLYSGEMEVRSEKQRFKLQIAINIQNQVLPKPHDWSYRLDLWQNPWVIAEYYKVKPWGAEHKSLLKKHMQLYADAGGKYITTYAVHSPWADNSYMIEGNMIEWTKKKDGKWKFDYNIFDQYVQLAIETGIDKAITLYTPIPWGDRFRYIDEATGNFVTEQWQATSEVFKSNWNIFLTDLKKHLESKGWLNKTYLGINENAMEQTLAAIKVIRDHSKQWKITYAGDWHTELDGLLDDYSCVFYKEPSVKDVQNRAARKQTSTYYICCTPAYPNTFVFSPPVEGRWLGWYTMAHAYDGMLRWAYDAWPADPVRDARHLLWPAGDSYMIYPGGESSIRFEKMREGIVDYEKIKILKAKAARSTNPEVKNLLQELNNHLQVFTAEKEFIEDKLKQHLQTGTILVNQLSEKLKN
ncbi:MAG TPA: glycoside hydrolase domain-containing protein, partial [Chitinophagaceae bacterium]|nr:glycoside hydrolase domain-containing protein [Chitinophagaceae bacterium]